MLVLPEFLAALVLLGVAFALAALPILRLPNREGQPPFGRLVAHPSQPSSMLSFVAFSAFLNLLALTRFGVFASLPLAHPLNSPDSSSRLLDAPQGVDVAIVDDQRSGMDRFRYPRNAADLVVDAARRVESAAREDRIRAVRDLAWWTGVCPNYAPFTVPRLTQALREHDPGIKGAAAIGLGSTGGHGAPAIPDLLAVRGTTVRYFDYLVAEAVHLIEHSPRWPPASECEGVPMEELERRAAQQGVGADERHAR